MIVSLVDKIEEKNPLWFAMWRAWGGLCLRRDHGRDSTYRKEANHVVHTQTIALIDSLHLQ